MAKYSYIFCKQTPKTNWIVLESTFSEGFYKTKEASRIGNNLIYYQNYNGGWGKNINMQNKINIIDKIYFKHKKDLWISTIDNDATVTEIDFL